MKKLLVLGFVLLGWCYFITTDTTKIRTVYQLQGEEIVDGEMYYSYTGVYKGTEEKCLVNTDLDLLSCNPL